MTEQQVKAFMKAVEASDIKTYEFDTDLTTHLYNDCETRVVKPSYSIGAFVAFRPNDYSGGTKVYQHNVQAVVADFGDVHEARTSGSSEQIEKFIKEIATDIDLTDDELKILVKIDKGNYGIIPETGNYIDAPKYLSPKQIADLSDEERTQYEAKVDKYNKEKANYIPANQAASISLG